MDNPQRKLALGEVHNPCRYYIWRSVWEKVMSR
jgi:hypothetical protein